MALYHQLKFPSTFIEYRSVSEWKGVVVISNFDSLEAANYKSTALGSCLVCLGLNSPLVSRRVEQNLHTNFSCPNPRSESEELQSSGCSKILLSFLKRFDGHFDQISNSSNVNVSSSRFWTATPLVIFYQLPSVSKSRIPPIKFDWFKASFP